MPRVLVVDDENLILEMIQSELEKNKLHVTVVNNSKDAIKEIDASDFDVILLDLMMPNITGLELLQMIKEKKIDASVILMTAYGSVETAVKAIKLGAFDYLTKPFSMDELQLVVNKAIEFRRNLESLKLFKKDFKCNFGLEMIIGKSKAINDVKMLVKRVADADAKVVLIEGESGTGKELVARAIHAEGIRCERPFVAINCASLPENLLESELFGYEKGAFTDAKTSKKGLIEYADGGTIFLDEIGDMPFNLQAKMLRFLEDRSVRKLGGLADLAVDVQVVVATNKNLKRLVSEGKFREDLFYRIQVVRIVLPPLRDRKQDILELAKFFITVYDKEFKKSIKGFAPLAEKMILQYDWPGNVRELRNAIERAMIFEDSDMITVERLPVEIITMSTRQSLASTRLLDLKIPQNGIDIEEVEKELVKQALSMTKGNQSKAAKLLNIGVDAMRYRMKKYGML